MIITIMINISINIRLLYELYSWWVCVQAQFFREWMLLFLITHNSLSSIVTHHSSLSLSFSPSAWSSSLGFLGSCIFDQTQSLVQYYHPSSITLATFSPTAWSSSLGFLGSCRAGLSQGRVVGCSEYQGFLLGNLLQFAIIIIIITAIIVIITSTAIIVIIINTVIIISPSVIKIIKMQWWYPSLTFTIIVLKWPTPGWQM